MKKPFNPRLRHNIVLFILSFIYIFIIGIFHDKVDTRFIYFTFISIIIIVSIFTVKDTGNKTLIFPLIVVGLTWFSEIVDLPLISNISGYLSFAFFLVVIVFLIIRVAKSKTVSILEFLESINVYLLLGIAASILFSAVYSFDHDAYNPPGELLISQADFIYYAFVTMTTLGYGDISPLNSVARSLSIFFSVAGQLYLAFVIAMLVGKYLSGGSQEAKPD